MLLQIVLYIFLHISLLCFVTFAADETPGQTAGESSGTPIGGVIAPPATLMLTYQVMDTCKEHGPKFLTGIEEAIAMAVRTIARIDNRENDKDFLRVFELLFKTTNQEAFDIVRGQFDVIRNIREQLTEGAEADIRIICDNDRLAENGGRWHAGKHDTWVDRKNNIQAAAGPFSLGCQQDRVWGATYIDARRNKIVPYNRATITICDRSLTKDHPVTFETAFSKTKQPDLSFLESGMHTLALDHAYGWKGCNALTQEQAIDNADSYTYLGLHSVAADMGFAIVRVGDTDYEERTLQGKLKYYKDITKLPAGITKRSSNEIKWMTCDLLPLSGSKCVPFIG